LRKNDKRQRRLEMPERVEEHSTPKSARAAGFLECVMKKISCGNARRESRIEQRHSTKKRMASPCRGCLERKT
jgi:hypothetical protein